jgi:hypothetical protein
VAVQASRLDRFHVRDALARADEDIRAGRLIASMALPQQTAALRDAVVAPLARAADLLRRDGGAGGEGSDGDGDGEEGWVGWGRGGVQPWHAAALRACRPRCAPSRNNLAGCEHVRLPPHRREPKPTGSARQ